MKLVTLVPSSEYMSYAGVRIRYQRLVSELAKRGIDLILQDISEFAPDRTEADVVVISKCYDPVALVVAAAMRQRGRLVGVDLFDDYFSQSGDSRMSRFRMWLEQALPSCDFALCSTDSMADVAKRCHRSIRTHVMNDPAADLRLGALPRILDRKLREARDNLTIRVAWFGVGDNPHFPVGLHDLSSFGESLGELRRDGMDVELRVLTNPRALTAERLALLKALPVTTVIDEWSEVAEEELLTTAFVAFLPVNAQPFSTAKSLNRAVTALTAGCQVLSVGYPLYEKLDTLIYRDASTLLKDLARGKMRLSPKRMTRYRDVMEKLASAETEASRLAQFLSGLEHSKVETSTLVVLHGHSTSGAAHKLVQSLNGLSVASPYCTVQLGFDVVFKATVEGLSMQISEKASRRLQSRQKHLIPVVEGANRRFLPVSNNSGRLPLDGASLDDASVPLQLATYAASVDEMRMRIAEAFGPCRFIVAETSRLPFSLAR